MNPIIEWVVSNSVVAILLAAVAFCITRFFRAPAVAHIVWLLVLIKMITPPLLQIPVEIKASDTTKSAAVAAIGQERAVHDVFLDEPLVNSNAGTAFLASEEKDVKAGLPAFSIFQGALFAWIGGSLIWFAIAFLRLRRFNALLEHAEDLPEEVKSDVQRVARKLNLKRIPQFVLVDGAVPPLLWFYSGRAKVALPKALMSALDRGERETLLTHELAHFLRRDHWCRWLELLILGVYWWHPLVWWAQRELRRNEEDCCDAWVLWTFPASAKSYTQSILKTLHFLANDRKPIPSFACGMGESRTYKNTRKRFTMILKNNTSHRMNRRQRVAVALFAIFTLPLSAYLLQSPAAAAETTEDKLDYDAPHKDHDDANRLDAFERQLDRIKDAISKLSKDTSDPSSQSSTKAKRRAVEVQCERLIGDIAYLREEAELADKIATMQLQRAKMALEEVKKQKDSGHIKSHTYEESKFDYAIAEIEMRQQKLMFKKRIHKAEMELKNFEAWLTE